MLSRLSLSNGRPHPRPPKPHPPRPCYIHGPQRVPAVFTTVPSVCFVPGTTTESVFQLTFLCSPRVSRALDKAAAICLRASPRLADTPSSSGF